MSDFKSKTRLKILVDQSFDSMVDLLVMLNKGKIIRQEKVLSKLPQKLVKEVLLKAQKRNKGK